MSKAIIIKVLIESFAEDMYENHDSCEGCPLCEDVECKCNCPAANYNGYEFEPTIYDEDHEEPIDDKTGEPVRSVSIDDKEKEEEIVAKLRLEGKSFEKIAKILGYASAVTFRRRYRGLPTSLVFKTHTVPITDMSAEEKAKEKETVAKLRLEGKSFGKIAKILGNISVSTLQERYRGLPTSIVHKVVVREDEMPEINKKIYEDIQATFKPRDKKKKTSLKVFLEQTKNQTLKGTYAPRHSLCEKK